MVAKRQQRCVMKLGAVGDKNRKCSVDQTLSFIRSFGSAVFMGLRGLWYSKDAAPELGHGYSVLCAAAKRVMWVNVPQLL